MNDYRIYTYSKETGNDDFLVTAESVLDIVKYMMRINPELEIISISKVGYLER